MNTHEQQIAKVKSLIMDLAKELTALDPEYIGGEEFDPENGYLFTAESTSPLRDRGKGSALQSGGQSQEPQCQKDLSELISTSRIRHQTEWVLKMKMPAKDSHVLLCISFCDGAIPEPQNPYSCTSTAHPDNRK